MRNIFNFKSNNVAMCGVSLQPAGITVKMALARYLQAH
jgi:hypothetical protein